MTPPKSILKVLFVLVFVSAGIVFADEAPNTYTTHSKGLYSGVKKIVLRSAEIVPEEHYSFKPTDSVRTYGQILGHIADSQYGFCSGVLGEKGQGRQIEKTKTTKADLIASLNDAFKYCDRAYDSMTDAAGTETIKFMGGDSPKLGVLNVNVVHTIEHYGNLVTYMRMKDLVPPTSDPEFMKTLMKR